MIHKTANALGSLLQDHGVTHHPVLTFLPSSSYLKMKITNMRVSCDQAIYVLFVVFHPLCEFYSQALIEVEGL